MVMTTDAYVVSPIFFPGGDIGSLAVHGTINDIAMAGARPLYLSASFIIEEGFPLADLKRIADEHGRGLARGGRADHHRRHQGRRARQGGRRVHLDRGRRRRAARPQALQRRGAARRFRRAFGHDRRPRRRGDVEARESRIRDADPFRFGGAARPRRGDGRGGRRRHARHARSDARRARRDAQRVRAPVARRLRHRGGGDSGAPRGRRGLRISRARSAQRRQRRQARRDSSRRMSSRRCSRR